MQSDVTETVPRAGRRWLGPMLACLLAAITAIVYWPALNAEFLTFDDHDYVTGNLAVQKGLQWDTVRWAFQAGHASNWHPLTWLSHALDCQLYGLNPMGHHGTNVLLHVVNAVLLFLLLSRWTGCIGRSAFVAAVFAWHPLRVESVAWVSERKDLLSGLFFFLTLMAYSQFARCRVQQRGFGVGTVTWYVVALFLFALGLMSKPSLVTLPFLLLLLDAWPLARWRPFTPGWGRSLMALVREKIPFFLLTAVSCGVTYSVQKAGHAVRDFSLETRLANVPVAYMRYLVKLIYPADLAVIYPFQPVSTLQALAAVAVLGGICYLVIRVTNQHGYVFTGWFWFLGVLVPMIGIIQVGTQGLADRYTYLSAIGLTFIVAWGVPEICRRFRWSAASYLAGIVAICVAMLLATHAYLAKWNNTIDLFTHATTVTGRHTIALKCMGVAHMEKARLSAAQDCFEQALQIDPTDGPTLFNLGSVLLQQRQSQRAVDYLRQALEGTPGISDAPAYTQVAISLAEAGLMDDAALFYKKVLIADPNSVIALNNLAWLRATAPQDSARNGLEAVQFARRACELTNRRVPLFLGTLAAAYAEAGQYAEAISTAEEARDKARLADQEEIVKSNGQLIELFRANRPFREAKTEK